TAELGSPVPLAAGAVGRIPDDPARRGNLYVQLGRGDPCRLRHDTRADLYGEYASCGGCGRADPPAGGRATIGSIMSTSYAEPVLTWYARNGRGLAWRALAADTWG